MCRVKRWILVALLSVLAALTLDPALVGVSTLLPVAQFIAMRTWVALGFVVVAALFALIAGITAAFTRLPRRLLTFALVLALVGAGHAAILASRGLSTSTLESARSGEIGVFTLNSLGGSVEAEAISAVVLRYQPEILTLPETPAELAHAVAQQVADGGGASYQIFTAGQGTVGTTSLLVDADLGEYRQVEAPGGTFGMVRAEPVDGEGPVALAVHPVPPTPGNMATWRRELGAVTALCESVPDLIMGGDFNATFDHAPLRRCTTAARGTGGLGTWPTTWDARAGATIDHVVIDPASWRSVGSALITVPGTDHRGVLVRLAPAS